MTPNKRRVEELVEQILRSLAPEIRTLVVHRFPDTDAWLCLWMARKFIPRAENAEVVFVNAGEQLPGSENDPAVIHFDTGGGDFDQHGKNLQRTSSAMIVAKQLKLQKDPGLSALLELTVKVDNVEELEVTSLHYIVEGLPRLHHLPNTNTPDWKKVQELVFDMFDIIYGQETQRKQSERNLDQHAVFHRLPNGITVTEIMEHPELRDAAFKRGASVVVWTQPRGKDNFYVGVQTSRQTPFIFLNRVVGALRTAEAEVRGINVTNIDLRYEGRGEPVTNWFLHDSKHLILSGSRTWQLKNGEFTKLAPDQICYAVRKALGTLSRAFVSQSGRNAAR